MKAKQHRSARDPCNMHGLLHKDMPEQNLLRKQSAPGLYEMFVAKMSITHGTQIFTLNATEKSTTATQN